MTIGSQKLSDLLSKLKKLPAKRKTFYLEKINQLKNAYRSATSELSDDADNERELKTKLTALVNKRFGKNGWSKAFAAFDKDKDGNINSKELASILEEAGVGNVFTRGQWVSGVLSKLDKDKTSKISLAELALIIPELKQKTSVASVPKSTTKTVASVPKLTTKTVASSVPSSPEEQRDWLLDTANWLDKVHSATVDSTKKTIANVSNLDLLFANNLEKVYNAVADEVKKIPKKTGEAIDELTDDSFWPYLIGGGVVLAAVLYLKR